MSIAARDGTLTAFWVSFPEDPAFPLGFGVTAWSEVDVCRLLEERGYDFHRRARRVEFRTVEKVDDVGLDHVSRGAGPIVVRGLWYPCGNVGFGAP
jgi:hypothetical protein